MGCWPSPDDPYCARLRSCFILSYNAYMLLLLFVVGRAGKWRGGGGGVLSELDHGVSRDRKRGLDAQNG